MSAFDDNDVVIIIILRSVTLIYCCNIRECSSPHNAICICLSIAMKMFTAGLRAAGRKRSFIFFQFWVNGWRQLVLLWIMEWPSRPCVPVISLLHLIHGSAKLRNHRDNSLFDFSSYREELFHYCKSYFAACWLTDGVSALRTPSSFVTLGLLM